MSLNIDSFLDVYIQSMKDDGVDFSILTYTDAFGDEQSVDTEQLTRDKIAILARDLWRHAANELVTTGVSTPLAQNQVILADATSGDITVTLPSVADTNGKTITVKRIDASANIVTVSGTIDGGSSFILYDAYGVQTFLSDGTQYWSLDSPRIVQRGSESFAASSTETVTMADAMPSTSYIVTISPDANPGGGWWITAKSTTQFTINFSGSVSLNARWEARI